MDILFVCTYFGGLASIICWIVYAATHHKKYGKTGVVSDGIVLVAVGVLLFGGLFLVNEYKKSIIEQRKNTSFDFCVHTKINDGEYITENQCWNMMDILDGKYADQIDYEPTDY